MLRQALVLLSTLPAVATAAPQKPAGEVDGGASTLAKRAFGSLRELQSAFDEAWRKEEAAFKVSRLEGIERYLGAKEPPADRADALLAASDLGAELERWAKAREHAERYLGEVSQGGRRGAMRLRIAQCLSREEGKGGEARKAYEKAVEEAGDDLEVGVGAAVELADLQVDAGDFAAAKATLEGFASKHESVRGLGEFLRSKAAELEEIGREPKPIDVTGIDGRPIRLADLKGKVVLLDFWATWCGPCRVELPNVLDVYRKHHDRGFEIVGISLDTDEDALREFVRDNRMTWPQYFDGKGWQNEVSVAYGVKGIPATYLLDREGKVHRVGLRGPALGRAVAKLLGSAAKGAAETP